MPTTCTGCSTEPATLKYTAEPPSASAVSPNGVKIESRAILPTTSRLIGRSHPVGGGDAEQAERIGEDDLGRAGKQEPGLLGGGTLGGAHRAGVVIPAMNYCGQLPEVS